MATGADNASKSYEIFTAIRRTKQQHHPEMYETLRRSDSLILFYLRRTGSAWLHAYIAYAAIGLLLVRSKRM